MLDQLEALQEAALGEVRDAVDTAALDAVQSAFLGKKGQVQQVLRSIGKLDPKERGAVGSAANATKQVVQAAIEARRGELIAAMDANLAEDEWVDATLPPPSASALSSGRGGTIHPITALVRDMEEVYLSMGFETLDGPWVEDDFHNFGALNIPPDHPARDMQDTYWLSDGNLLRTHTSPVQVRAMETRKPPIRAVCLGRIFRNEELDATHENTFHQCEGFFVDRDVSVGHMVYVLETLLHEIIGKDAKIRLRPGYFPFVEPGFEVDVMFRGDWMELLGCGMVHPYVLEQGGIDPDEYSGFAFGMGIDRLVMVRHGIEDIRHLMSGDLRFMQQFAGGLDG